MILVEKVGNAPTQAAPSDLQSGELTYAQLLQGEMVKVRRFELLTPAQRS